MLSNFTEIVLFFGEIFRYVMLRGGVSMSKMDKLMDAVLKQNPNLRFDDLCKVLITLGYEQCQPNSGSSHYTFRKFGCTPITIPRHTPINKAYISLVKRALQVYLEEDQG